MFGVSVGIMAAGGAGGGGGSYESIATATGTGSSGTITFSSIPSTYKHLQIRMIANDGAENNISLRFNSSTTGYSNHTLTGDGTSALASGSSGTNRMSNVGWTSPTTNTMSGTIINIIDYASTTKNKTVRSFVGRDNNSGNTDSFVRLMSGLWENTSAVTSIELLDAGASFTTNSVFSLYGIKG